ncbi:MAG: histidine phosphatase family protein [Bacillus sp. (in: Bacteria)]|nr:histidine phosphatase family protein [Bacillus sp. (in: firmicutes)]MCM1427455.1 histidine phosphatase family protein [Eubacterium sp.]
MWNRTKNQVTLAFIRHGETQANKENRYLGTTDESLSKEGIRQLLSYRKQGIYPDVQYLFTSPMKRCLESARILYPEITPVIIPEWREIDFGRFEYKNYEELKDDRQYQAWIDSGGTLAFPDGESRENFTWRCEKGFRRMCGMLRQSVDDGVKAPLRTALVVHGGTMMSLLSVYGIYHSRKEKKSYFDYQTLNGRGYLCTMKKWYDGSMSEKMDIQIEIEADI